MEKEKKEAVTMSYSSTLHGLKASPPETCQGEEEKGGDREHNSPVIWHFLCSKQISKLPKKNIKAGLCKASLSFQVSRRLGQEEHKFKPMLSN